MKLPKMPLMLQTLQKIIVLLITIPPEALASSPPGPLSAPKNGAASVCALRIVENIFASRSSAA